MKHLVRLLTLVLLTGPAVLPAEAAFSSIYVFGDGASTTTNNPFAGPYYHGFRRCNGRVWVEVLAQRLGLPNNTVTNVNWSYSSNNISYYGHYSADLVLNVAGFPAPTNANTALFVVWVNDADFVDDMGKIYAVYGTNIAQWTNAINQSLTNHFKAITNLYAKGVRSLILPTAVDISAIPQYNFYPTADRSFIRRRVMDFNTAFTTTLLNQLKTNCPGLAICVPDFFTLLDSFLTHPSDYGFTNALFDGRTIDVLEDPSLSDKSLQGPGTNYIFWDVADPTAKAHEIMADLAQHLLSPASVIQVTALPGSNRLDVASLPIGLGGFVDARSDLITGNWTPVTDFNSTAATQAVFVPVAGSGKFYRLRFPFAWTWP